MSHENFRAALDRQFAGEPLDAETAAHVETCVECRDYQAKLMHVDSALAGGGMGQGRQDALEARLFARLGVEAPKSDEVAPSVAAAPSRRGWFALAGVLAAAVLFLVFRPAKDEAFTPRGTKDAAFGVRAFCVEGGKVVGEARGGQTLPCGAGQVLQLSYTASSSARLNISLDGQEAIFPASVEGDAPVEQGIDVALPFSTPVGEWLSKPRVLKWHFVDGEKKPHDGSLTITPR